MHVAAGHAELLGCVLISDFFTGDSVFWDEVEGDLGVSSSPFPRAAGGQRCGGFQTRVCCLWSLWWTLSPWEKPGVPRMFLWDLSLCEKGIWCGSHCGLLPSLC